MRHSVLEAEPKRRTVIEIGAPVPGPIPSFRFHRGLQLGDVFAPTYGALGISARFCHTGKFRQRGDQEPGQPHALSFAQMTNPVHAIIPVTAAHQRQTVRRRFSGSDRAFAHSAQTGWLAAPTGSARNRHLPVPGPVQALQKRRYFVEYSRIAAHLDIVRHDIRQPDKVVGEMGAHAALGGRMPPMLHIALDKLMRRRTEDMGAGQDRAGLPPSAMLSCS